MYHRKYRLPGSADSGNLKQHKSTRIITPAAMIEILKEAESGK
jgi:hypothetical protein